MGTLYEFVQDHLKSGKGDWVAIANASGVPYGTLKKIANGATTRPRIDTVEKLARYFREQAAA